MPYYHLSVHYHHQSLSSITTIIINIFIITITIRNQRTDVSFEDSAYWLPSLELMIIELGKLVDGATSSIAFPISTIQEELEEIATTLTLCHHSDHHNSQDQHHDGNNNVSMSTNTTTTLTTASISLRGWTSVCLFEIGFTHGTLIEVYMEILNHWGGKAAEKLVHVLSSTSYVLLQWTRLAAE
jgi:hypothetical protein